MQNGIYAEITEDGKVKPLNPKDGKIHVIYNESFPDPDGVFVVQEGCYVRFHMLCDNIYEVVAVDDDLERLKRIND